METLAVVVVEALRDGLGNFLSGMETLHHSRWEAVAQCPLETSLVEWKRPSAIPINSASSTLETSLVEWKQLSLLDKKIE